MREAKHFQESSLWANSSVKNGKHWENVEYLPVGGIIVSSVSGSCSLFGGILGSDLLPLRPTVACVSR